MSGCLDNIHCACGIDWSDKRNAVAAVTAGVLFFSGWWIIIDIASCYPSESEFPHAFYTCGVISTLSMFMINAVSNSQVRGDSMNEGLLGSKGARVWLLFGFLIGFGSLIAACWIMFGVYVVPNKSIKWPGVALFLQNFFIFFGSIIYKFGRTEELWG